MAAAGVASVDVCVGRPWTCGCGRGRCHCGRGHVMTVKNIASVEVAAQTAASYVVAALRTRPSEGGRGGHCCG